MSFVTQNIFESSLDWCDLRYEGADRSSKVFQSTNPVRKYGFNNSGYCQLAHTPLSGGFSAHCVDDMRHCRIRQIHFSKSHCSILSLLHPYLYRRDNLFPAWPLWQRLSAIQIRRVSSRSRRHLSRAVPAASPGRKEYSIGSVILLPGGPNGVQGDD